jgi:hypothetical protein
MRQNTRHFDHEEVAKRNYIHLDGPDYDDDELEDVEFDDYDDYEEDQEILTRKERRDQELRFYSVVFTCCAVAVGVVYLIARFIAYPFLKKVVDCFDE